MTRPHIYSLVAAAEVVTSRGVLKKTSPVGLLDWQERAWTYFDTVGEFRFGVSWQANALSRVNLVAAKPPEAVGDEPTAIGIEDDDTTPAQKRAVELVAAIAGGASGQGQLLNEFGQHLGVAGFGWLVAEPSLDDPMSDEYETWNVYSQDTLRIQGDDDRAVIEVRTATKGNSSWRKVHPNALVVKVWRKHPRRPWEPDAPVRAVLGILEQLDLLSAHITATGRSRLAGAGILAIPAEAEFPPPPPGEGDEIDPTTPQDGFDYFTQQLTEMMTVPITDRDSAAAVVPLTVAIPGEFVDKLKHITFSTPFDDRVQELQADAIKRLALGLDMPPEVLTGMAGVNHWTAWQVEETAITLHVEPNAETVCQALTQGFLRLALEAEGHDPAAAIVWYDTGDLTTPPDKSGSAFQAYDRIQLSAKALRRETGFAEADAPDDEEFKQRVLLDAAKGAPTLAPSMLAKAGILPEEVADAATPDAPQNVPDGDLTDDPADSGANTPPDADGRPDGERTAAAHAAVVMACDGIVYRALERAGSKLRNAVGRSTTGPQAVDGSITAAEMHVRYDPTVFSDLDHLLEGAFDRVPEIADALEMDAEALHATLNAYCRGLLASQHRHERLRLLAALGVEAQL
jgi:hypothetical protein